MFLKYSGFFPLLLFIFISSNCDSFAIDKKATNYFYGTKVTHIVPFRNEILFGTAGKGILIFDKKKGTWSQINSNNSSLKNDIIECLAVSEDFIWAGGTDGLSVCDRATNKWSQKKFSSGGIYGLWIRSLFYDSLRNEIWVGRFTNLTRCEIDKNKWTDFDLTKKKDSQTNNIRALWMSEGKYLWAGTESGIYKIDVNNTVKNNFDYFDTFTKGFCNNSNYASVSLIRNNKNLVFIGLAEFITLDKPNYNTGGLYSIDTNKKWNSFDKKKGLIANGIYSIDFIGNYMAIGTYDFNPGSKSEKGTGLTMINKTTGKIYNVKAKDFGIVNDKILALHFDGRYLWLGTYSGISRINLDDGFVYRF